MTTQNIPANGSVLRTRTHVSGRDFLTVFRFMARRKWLPFLGMISGAALGVAYLALTPPLYSASSRVIIESHKGQEAAVASEIEIIESTPVLSKVAGTLGLYRDPRFNKPNIVEKFLSNYNEENALRERVISRLSRMLHVQRIPDTSIIEMTVRHPNADRAAQIANVVLSAYRERKMDERFEQSRQLGEWMGRQIESVKAQADEAKKKLEAFRAEHEIETAMAENTEGKTSVEALKASIAETKAKITKLQGQMDSVKGANAAIRAIDPVLKKEENRLTGELGALLQRYGDKHPKVVAVKAEIGNVRAKMGRKTANPVQGIKSEIAALTEKTKQMEEEFAVISKTVNGGGRVKAEFEALEAEVETGARLHENLLLKYQDTLTQSELREEAVSVVSMATIPSKPDQGERIRVVAGLGLFGFFAAFSLLLIRALCNTGFTNAGQLESLTGYPVFASVPNAAAKGIAIHHTIIEKPAAIMAEALRSLRVALRLRSEGVRGPRVIALTSTLPDEGKTSLAVMLSMIAAKSGERVCIVDCDLRRPSLHKAFGIGNARGLQDYLSNNAGLEDSIYRRDPSGVHVVTAKSVPSYSLTLLTSGRMEQMIEALREQYDLVILDAPSSLAFADARVLARMVDQMLYVVAWNRTRREGVLNSLKAYADMGYENLALVLNKVDLREYLRESASAVIYQYGYEGEGEGEASAA